MGGLTPVTCPRIFSSRIPSSWSSDCDYLLAWLVFRFGDRRSCGWMLLIQLGVTQRPRSTGLSSIKIVACLRRNVVFGLMASLAQGLHEWHFDYGGWLVFYTFYSLVCIYSCSSSWSFGSQLPPFEHSINLVQCLIYYKTSRKKKKRTMISPELITKLINRQHPPSQRLSIIIGPSSSVKWKVHISRKLLRIGPYWDGLRWRTWRSIKRRSVFWSFN